MKTKLYRAAACALLLMLCMLPLCGIGAAATSVASRYTNPDTGYQVYILDDGDYLTDEEESRLEEQMKDITEYGDIILWSTKEKTDDEIQQAKEKRYDICGNRSSGILLINMGVRRVTFQSDGAINKMLKDSKAHSITDNISRFALNKEYYDCASKCFSQVYEVLHGNAIVEPMRYISYGAIGLMIAFILVVSVVFSTGLNPLTLKTKAGAKLVGKGRLFVTKPIIDETSRRERDWVDSAFALARIGRVFTFFVDPGGPSGGSSGGGGSSSGGGGGGSSRF